MSDQLRPPSDGELPPAIVRAFANARESRPPAALRERFLAAAAGGDPEDVGPRRRNLDARARRGATWTRRLAAMAAGFALWTVAGLVLEGRRERPPTGPVDAVLPVVADPGRATTPSTLVAAAPELALIEALHAQGTTSTTTTGENR